MNTILVIGASRGIGLEFARQYLAAGERVIATARDELVEEAGGDAVQGQVVLAVVQAYGDMLAASEVLRLYRELAGQTVEIERQARERFRTGETPSTDVAQAASRAAEARADLARAEGMQVSARARYRNLTGLEPVDLQPIPPNPPLPGSLDDAMAIAMGGSPALRQARGDLGVPIGFDPLQRGLQAFCGRDILARIAGIGCEIELPPGRERRRRCACPTGNWARNVPGLPLPSRPSSARRRPCGASTTRWKQR